MTKKINLHIIPWQLLFIKIMCTSFLRDHEYCARKILLVNLEMKNDLLS